MPAPSSTWMAGMPSSVPGTFTITLNRSTVPQSHVARRRWWRCLGEFGGDLHAHVPVAAIALVVHGSEDVGRRADISDGEGLVDRLGVGRARAAQFGDRDVVVTRAGDGRVEDRRVGGHTPRALLRHHVLELTGGEQRPAYAVVPGALAESKRLLDRDRHRRLLYVSIWREASSWCCCAIWWRAASATLSGVKPNLVWRSLSGAEAPNVSMPMTAPSVPT